jgi:endonuclease G, mitochondrial
MQLGVHAPSPTSGDSTSNLDRLLYLLSDAKSALYYDADADQQACQQYYQSIDAATLSPAQLYDTLHALLADTHTRVFTYNEARQQHLYPCVDLQPDLRLRSIYTGESYDPAELLRHDLELTRTVENQIRDRLGALGPMDERTFGEHVDALEAALSVAYNAEHAVPQSWFGQRLPMRSDLHHLFTCESTCNSFRGNTPFFDFQDYARVVRQGCGRREQDRFEPSCGRGAVARATLYFLLRYPGEINRTAREYTDDRVAQLLVWHDQDPVTVWEKHRNATIFEAQGDRNPLVDYPEWARLVDFARGLG